MEIYEWCICTALTGQNYNGLCASYQMLLLAIKVSAMTENYEMDVIGKASYNW